MRSPRNQVSERAVENYIQGDSWTRRNVVKCWSEGERLLKGVERVQKWLWGWPSKNRLGLKQETVGKKVGGRGILRTSQDEDCPGQSSGPHMAERAEHGAVRLVGAKKTDAQGSKAI